MVTFLITGIWRVQSEITVEALISDHLENMWWCPNVFQKIIEKKRRVCEPLQPVLPPYSTASLHFLPSQLTLTFPSQLCK